jgi:hypothetical protein
MLAQSIVYYSSGSSCLSQCVCPCRVCRGVVLFCVKTQILAPDGESEGNSDGKNVPILKKEACRYKCLFC